jgi:glucose/arabinose dehydrogenase
MGDGGGGGDTSDNAQNPMLLLGKVIRIDVDSSAGTAPDCTGLGSGGYTVPLANPSVDGAGGSCDEIWATGFRNPWRSSFDRSTGDLYLGDVGQGDWEEVDLQEAGGPGGENYGWRCYEGDHAFNTTGCGPAGDYTFPIVEYSSGAGSSDCTVIGGYVYRGALYPAMAGRYLLTDYCSGNFRDLVPDGAGGWTATAHSELPMTFGYVSFGEDAAGELYVVNINNGNLYQVQAS